MDKIRHVSKCVFLFSSGNWVGVVHKRRPYSGILSSADNFRTWVKGDLQMWTTSLLGTQTSDFLKFMVCPHNKGVEPVRIFAGKGESIFRDFVLTLLWTTPSFLSGYIYITAISKSLNYCNYYVSQVYRKMSFLNRKGVNCDDT